MKKLLSFIIISTLLFSCREEKLNIVFENEPDSLIVIQGYITNAEDSVRLQIVWTQSPDSLRPIFNKVEDIYIQLFENNNPVANFFTTPSIDYYITYFKPKEQQTYTIKAITPYFNDTIIATTYIPPHGTIKHISTIVIPAPESSTGRDYFLQYRLRVIDPEPTKTNYFALGYITYNFNNLRYMKINDPILGQWDELNPQTKDIFKVFTFTDENFSDSIDFDVQIWFYANFSGCGSAKIKFLLYTLSYEGYYYLTSLNGAIGEEIWDIPIGAFTEPAIIYFNVENALGSFFGYSTDTTKLISQTICQ